jgi:transposase-like protein
VSETRRTYWSKLISEQAVSGQAVRLFCQERGVGEHSFYYWRKRLQKNEPVRFALLEAKTQIEDMAPALELVLSTGERLRIGNGVNAATLRVVLETVRR